MKITSINRSIDENTFCPVVKIGLELELNLEIMQDSTAKDGKITTKDGEISLANILGMELMAALKEGMAELRNRERSEV